MGKIINVPSVFYDYSQTTNFGIAHVDSLVKARNRGSTDGNNTNISSPVPKTAVLVKNVEYCHLKSKQKVLNGLSMSVNQGSIYGLTGSSGCGKTTLISCILGNRTVSSGDIFLYGCNNTHPNRQAIVNIPGKGVGFMPQELSLYSKFTVHEILSYFGNLHAMSSDEIVNSTQNLLELLQLSRRTTLIELLSGGEQRRVSFAIALIHSPKLLVLDEPTAGMDALLRIRIWDFLHDRVKERHVTVIITSHYMDEMKKADKIGIMRNGQIIAENSPQALLTLCRANSLDDAVLNLCKNDNLTATQTWVTNQNYKFHSHSNDSAIIYFPKTRSTHFYKSRESFHRIKSMTRKNMYLLLRNLPLLFFIMCIPAFQLLTVLMVGYEPSHLRLGVVNKELNLSDPIISGNNDTFLSTQSCPEFTEELRNYSCDFYLLSCRFLSHMSGEKISLVNLNSEENAVIAVNNGDVYGYVVFGSNFSTSLIDRALSQNENGTVDEDAFTQSQIIAQFDQSNTIIYRLMWKELFESQENFLTSLMSACGGNRRLGEYPLQYRSPIFGIAGDFSISDYVAPGVPIPFMFFFSIISSGLRIVDERSLGTLDRMLISGVKLSEIMASFVATDFFLITAQSFLLFTLLSWWLPMHNFEFFAASFAFFLMILAGCVGVSVGLLLGSICKEHVQLAIISIAFMLPNIILSGIIWPLEAMPEMLQTIVQFLPCNLSSKAISCIWVRGLGITHPNVWPGIIVLISYVLAINFITVIYHKTVKI